MIDTNTTKQTFQVTVLEWKETNLTSYYLEDTFY